MSAQRQLRQAYDSLQAEGEILAGGLADLNQRATVYRQIYRESGGNHIFPLIAAHGALWARGYFAWGFALARTLVWQYFHSAPQRQQQLAALADFADAFREVNRRVCVDTYASYHFTARYGEESGAEEFVAQDLLAALLPLHQARRTRRALGALEQQAVFTAHFLNEQRHVVGPRIESAVKAFDWPLLKVIALKPIVRFAYFPVGRRLLFGNFTSRQERIENGLRAFEIGARVGWSAVEAKLADYQQLPSRFFTHPEDNYANLRAALLGS